ncbi:D-beta-hydroxybutyrate dehydrogenase, mitochondrial [Culicoides brevitarsis]|uniref:D-beta-hydroxybutyrate dehydrogenase, mitochondrial n=1 Tax=Culicoides brevitarsis TaxID=469753 RepID=UPI00307C5FB8
MFLSLHLAMVVKSLVSWFLSAFWRQKQIKVNRNLVVLITGCDSGLGHFAARRCHEEGFTVIATVLDKNSNGSKKLLQEIGDSEYFHSIPMNLKSDESIKSVYDFASKFMENNDVRFHALINNAGVMCFGEFEWLTSDIMNEELRVNLIGPMTLVKHFLPMIRQHKTRIINVTSHCSLKSLPGLSVYSASKAGFRFWTEALEKELYKFGVRVVNFIPGSFITSSNIVNRSLMLSKTMKNGLSKEQIDTYGYYFEEYYTYLGHVANYVTEFPTEFHPEIISKLMNAITDENPRCLYKAEPWRYTFYYNLFRIIPQGPLERWLVEKFMLMPKMKINK